jgi:hypothetical protein
MKKKRRSKAIPNIPNKGINKKATYKLPRIKKVSQVFEPGVGDNY